MACIVLLKILLHPCGCGRTRFLASATRTAGRRWKILRGWAHVMHMSQMELHVRELVGMAEAERRRLHGLSPYSMHFGTLGRRAPQPPTYCSSCSTSYHNYPYRHNYDDDYYQCCSWATNAL